MIAPKLRFSEFKEVIRESEIGKFTILMQSGLSRQLSDEDIGLPVLRSNNLDGNQVNITDIKYWYLEDPQGANTQNYFLDSNDLLVNFINSLSQIGKSAIYRNQLKRDTILTTNILRLKFNQQINPLFISYFFQTKKYSDYIQSITKPAVNQASFTTKDLAKLLIPVISIDEQTKIAEFLSAVDDKISQLSRQLELLNQYKKGVMQKIFSQEIRFKNDNGEDFGEWEEMQLKDFLNLNLRPIDKPSDNYHALGVRSHFKGLFSKYDSKPDKNSMDTLYEVFENDVVVNITFAWEGAMAIANKSHHKGLVSHRFPTYCTDESKILLNFFRYRFIQKDFLSALQLCSPGGAGRNRVLSKKDFLEISILKPPVQEQKKIAEFLTAIDKQIDHTTAQLTHTKQWKKGLLQQMFI